MCANASTSVFQAEKVAAFYDARTVTASRKRPRQDSAGTEDPATALGRSGPDAGKPADLAPAILSVEGRLHPVQVQDSSGGMGINFSIAMYGLPGSWVSRSS